MAVVQEVVEGDADEVKPGVAVVHEVEEDDVEEVKPGRPLVQEVVEDDVAEPMQETANGVQTANGLQSSVLLGTNHTVPVIEEVED